MSKQSRGIVKTHGALVAAAIDHNIQVAFRQPGIVTVAGEGG
jgi:hypothetical protein